MGRKPKYHTEEERLQAKREAQRRYNEKHHEKRLEHWRTQNSKRKDLVDKGKKYISLEEAYDQIMKMEDPEARYWSTLRVLGLAGDSDDEN